MSLYPELGMDNPSFTNAQDFRLKKIDDLLLYFKSEIDHYENVKKKYQRVRSILNNTSVALGVVSIVLTGSGAATAATGPGIIVGIPLASVGGLLSLVTASLTVASKNLNKKVSKHERTIKLNLSKRDSVSIRLLKALEDNKIDEN